MRKDAKKGLIFNIQRFSIHDGSGIRTLVFMKGCPLKCKWCSNPESQKFGKEILFFREKCIGCGACVKVCPNHAVDTETFDILRGSCTACGACARVCVADAKKTVGESKSVADIMVDIERDRIFYRNSKGGVTIGGGEPLMQHEFVEELLKTCKAKNIHTSIETCGFADWNDVRGIFETVDHDFYDLKHSNDERHKKITGVSNRIILENAEKVACLGKNITFRLPLVPGYNDDLNNLFQTGSFLKKLLRQNRNIRLEILEYHGLGENKYHGLDRSYELEGVLSDAQKLEQSRQIIRDMGITVIS